MQFFNLKNQNLVQKFSSKIKIHCISEKFNSDASRFGGSGVENRGDLISEAIPNCGRDFSLCLNLPPLAGVLLRYYP